MKQNRIVLLSVTGIAGIVAVMFFVGRSMIGRIADRIPGERSPRQIESTDTGSEIRQVGEREQRVFDIRDFNQIQSEGAWDIEIVYGESYRVEVIARSDAFRELNIGKGGDSLLLDVEDKNFLRTLDVDARVVLPFLEQIRAYGGSKIRIVGFESKELSIETEGGTDISASDCRIEELEIEADGAANIDMRDAEIVNANLVLNGAGNARINMAGGILEGEINGLGKITYSGNVEEERIQINGLGRVDRE